MAKKSKVVKKALAKTASPAGKKTTPKKVLAKPAASKLKKAPVKTVSPKGKKAPLKKVVPKKSVKKAPLKKAAPIKVTVKKAAGSAKKATAKKTMPVKPTQRKLQVPAKAVVKPAGPAKVTKKKATPVLSPVLLPDATVENAANMNQQIRVPGDGFSMKDEPVKTSDKNAFNKATSKGDPHNKLYLSSKPKNSIKPSGKKPLW